MYCVKTKDVFGHEITMEVLFEIYQAFEDERKLVERQRNEYRRHRDNREIDAYILSDCPLAVSDSTEDVFFRREALHEVQAVLQTCTPLQRERFALHVFGGLNCAQIARMQHCCREVFSESIKTVRKKLKGIR